MHQRIQTDFSLPILDTEHHVEGCQGSPDQIYITPSSQPHRGDGIAQKPSGERRNCFATAQIG